MDVTQVEASEFPGLQRNLCPILGVIETHRVTGSSPGGQKSRLDDAFEDLVWAPQIILCACTDAVLV